MKRITRREFLKDAMIMGAGALVMPAALYPETHADASDKGSSALFRLPPFLGRPTRNSMALNVVAGEKDLSCYLTFRKLDTPGPGTWQRTDTFVCRGLSPAEITLGPLMPGTLYQYQVYARPGDRGEFQPVTGHTFRTQRAGPDPFSFAMVSDSHITPFHNDRFDVLSEVSLSILSRRPDFVVMLGDNIQTFTSHGGPMTEKGFGPILYSLLRRALGPLPSSVPVYKVIGNWEGENGWHPDLERSWARDARLAFIPNPGPDTYPQRGSRHEDYYGFTWGDALFLVLNVTGYTPTNHTLQSPMGRADDWSLGQGQREWLFEQLSKSRARWKLLFIHHTVGGNGGDEVNSRYGRGGGRAAGIGEQALIHRWMRKFGVQALFYGHDHVFTDIVVDGIHYICVGSAGAPWKFSKSITGYKRYWTPSGYTMVDVGRDALRISFIRPDPGAAGGEVLHSFDIPLKEKAG